MRPSNLAFWTMTLLSFGTGALDAVTYLSMDNVFGANMTGNLILIGLSLAGEGSHSLLGPLSALGGFVTGSWLIGLIARRYPKSDTIDPVVAPVFATCAIGMAVITTLLFWLPTQAMLPTATFAIGTLMGFQALGARRVGVPDISTVVITSTLSLLLSEVGTTRGASIHATTRRVAAVLSMFLGALGGALLLNIGQTYAMTLPTTILLVTATVYTTRAVRSSKIAGARTNKVPLNA